MNPSRNTRKSPLSWVVASILLLAAVIASFWVPLYARSTPKLGAFPFFYWYQLILVPAVAVVSWLAYLLLRSESGSVSAAAVDTPAPSEPPAAPAAREVDSGPGTAL